MELPKALKSKKNIDTHENVKLAPRDDAGQIDTSYVNIHKYENSISENADHGVNGIFGGIDEDETPSGSRLKSSTGTTIGGNGTGGESYDGFISTIKISNVKRSKTYLQSNYNAEKENNDFITLGAEETQ